MSDVKEKECVQAIFDKLKGMTKGGILNENYNKILGITPTDGMTDTSSRILQMVNTSNSSEKETFIDSVLNDQEYKNVKQQNQSGTVISGVVLTKIEEFITKIRSSMDVFNRTEVKCSLELHDTIDRATRSETTGDRCHALNIFLAMIRAIKKYIDNNNNSNKKPDTTKLFNFPIYINFSDSIFGSGFKKSYKSCNNNADLSIGGSKSRRIRRRKHNRKTHRKHARKTRHKRESKSHKHRRHSRAARKHKKHTSRR
jgi:hypothetical protein